MADPRPLSPVADLPPDASPLLSRAAGAYPDVLAAQQAVEEIGRPGGKAATARKLDTTARWELAAKLLGE